MIQNLYKILKKRGFVKNSITFSRDWLAKRESYYVSTKWKLNTDIQPDVSVESYMRIYFKLKDKNEEALRGYILTHVENMLA